MPELPEVEVTRRSLQKLTGARVLAVRQGAALRWPLGIEPSALVGRTVVDVGRRGKYVLLRLDEGLLGDQLVETGGHHATSFLWTPCSYSSRNSSTAAR